MNCDCSAVHRTFLLFTNASDDRFETWHVQVQLPNLDRICGQFMRRVEASQRPVSIGTARMGDTNDATQLMNFNKDCLYKFFNNSLRTIQSFYTISKLNLFVLTEI